MSERQDNLHRLLNPRHIAFIGGRDAAFSASQCARTFDGPVWGVNPKRSDLGGVPCFPSVHDLPEAPDAVFLAVPRQNAIPVVQQLSDRGAGGVACFTAGFGELGEAGKADEQALIQAAGDMALVGPNCYGLINYTNGACLWPFGAGDQKCERGIALVMQSGMLPANFTMNDRSVPISFIVSAGNQAVLTIEDYIDALVDDPRVSAIGMYIEGIKQIDQFAAAATRALEQQKPLVVLKAGSSDLASRLTVSHTGSLAGSDQIFQAFFDQLGIIRVDSPVVMLETLKLLSVSGAPRGDKVAFFTCSGGDAAMVADYADKTGLRLSQPSAPTRRKLTELLPDIATVSNPLDYTTPLWGNTEVMPDIFKALISDGFDAAVIIQDYPPPHIHEDNSFYRNDGLSFMQACNQLGVPGAVCSDLPENIDAETRSLLIEGKITPLQGFDAGIDSMANACRYGSNRNRLLVNIHDLPFETIETPDSNGSTRVIDEYTGKRRLLDHGITIPTGVQIRHGDNPRALDTCVFPVIAKANSTDLPHKSEAGALQPNLGDVRAVSNAMIEIQKSVRHYNPEIRIEGFLVESMVENVIAELLVGINTDPQFGQVMVIASGGILVELLQDSVTLLLPTNADRVTQALKSLRGYPLLQGYRGKPAVNFERLVTTILSLADFAEKHQSKLLELDVNPLLLTETECVAADVMIREMAD
ncbi:MAG: acetate--CoA ligase family protein [Pseudomonadota bacterium]